MKLPNFRSRPLFLALLSVLMALILVGRLYYLQIIRGAEFTQSFEESVTRTVSIPAKRGRILDRNGNVIADTQASQNVTIVDNTGNTTAENDRLNRIIQKTLTVLLDNEEDFEDDFGISWNGSGYEFNYDGFDHLRFLADVYGYPLIDTLTPEQKESSAEDVVFMLADRYKIPKKMNTSKESILLLDTVITRYRLALNAFQKYIPTVLARNVGTDTVDAIMAESDLDGISIANTYKRVYNDSKYMSGLTGYISLVSAEEMEENEGVYDAGDYVGKVGLEASMEETLRGKNGYREISVDNLGREKSEISYTRPQDGNDVYLTIDSDLQKTVYKLLEKTMRDIILSKLTDSVTSFEITEETDGSDILIPAADVYGSILSYIIDRDHFDSEDASESEEQMRGILQAYLESVKEGIRSELRAGRTPFNALTPEYRQYASYISRALFDRGVIDTSLVDADDEIYREWTGGSTESLGGFLYHAAAEKWIDRSLIGTESEDTDEVFEALVQYVLDEPCEDYSFGNIMCKYVCESGAASGELVCRILFDQKIFDPADSERDGIESGRKGAAFDYIKRLIENDDLTPGDLHLYPFCGSVVVTDPRDGTVLALVSYPGYDCNRIQESGYIDRISANPSRPLLNHATQQRYAPGSTFKMVTAAAGISEGVVTRSDTVSCHDRFDKIDPSPACWIYPGGHGHMNMQNAITNSCNMYFYEVGYRLGELGGSFSNDDGIQVLSEYAAMYGLDRKSGVEIEEAEPSVATKDVVRASIGQSNNGYTTAALARYVTAVATQGDLYDLTLLDHSQDKDGNVLEEYSAESLDPVEVSDDYWESITEGMRRVCANNSAFNSVRYSEDDGSGRVSAAGKTGTAQQSLSAPNHALFLGYAPVDDPEIAIAVCIPNGYSSSYAALVASQVMQYYFDPDSLSGILSSNDIPNYTNGD
ncbi:MAG: penicillin-binding protein [Lachnospiraceae bacterium]|nr:penicillin-binding protein [Lachnospiraceae bacterium]